jgi:nucleoside-diphosphate-sugar epimerase
LAPFSHSPNKLPPAKKSKNRKRKMKPNILVVGASGWLGSKVATELVALGLAPRLLIRGGAEHPKAKALFPLVAQGAQIVSGDLSDAASLQRATQNVDAIISAVQGGPDLIIDGQVRLAQAGLANGVQRIFPSDYAVRFDGVSPAYHLFLGWRAQANAAIGEIGLAQTNTFNGAFMEMLAQDFFGLVDWDAKVICYWGDPDQSYDFTHTDDVARFVAANAADSKAPSGPFEIVGQTASPRQLAEIASRVSGSKFELRSLGDLQQLDAAIAAKQAASPSDPTPWAGLQYHRLMANGQGKLLKPQNAQFPKITPSQVSDFLSLVH